MAKKYTGIIIEESFDDNRIINDVQVLKIHISGHEHQADRWHLYEVRVTKQDISMLAEHLINTWYMHFWIGTQVTAVFTGYRVFTFDYSDRSTWHEVLAYGHSVGMTNEQLDFPITGL